MRGPSFLHTLQETVARVQAAHPEREGDLARAHALILQGMVTTSPADPTTGRVLSSDGQTWYSVNSHCSCQAGQHGRGCKHAHAWKLYQYVERRLATQAAQEPQEAPQTTADTSPVPDTPPRLPAASPAIPAQYLVLVHGQPFVR